MAYVEIEISFNPQRHRPEDVSEDQIDDVIYLEIEAEADVSKYRPAKINGRPEDCYPEEGGEVEITSYRCITPGYEDLTEKQIDWLMSKKDWARLEEMLFDEAQEDDGRDYDFERDLREDR